jgi:hypothetical protein
MHEGHEFNAVKVHPYPFPWMIIDHAFLSAEWTEKLCTLLLCYAYLKYLFPGPGKTLLTFHGSPSSSSAE